MFCFSFSLSLSLSLSLSFVSFFRPIWFPPSTLELILGFSFFDSLFRLLLSFTWKSVRYCSLGPRLCYHYVCVCVCARARVGECVCVRVNSNSSGERKRTRKKTTKGNLRRPSLFFSSTPPPHLSSLTFLSDSPTSFASKTNLCIPLLFFFSIFIGRFQWAG